jgi:hypothetical protein
MLIQPYLFFDGRCEEALEFYKSKLGAKVEMLMRFKENPEPTANPPGSDDKVMHACRGDGLGWPLHEQAELPGILALPHGEGRG